MHTPLNDTAIERFWQNIVLPESEDDCWGWLGNVSSNGMPTITAKSIHYFAGRISWTLMRGEIPENTRIRRTCGNKACNNPRHMILVGIGVAEMNFWEKVNIVDDENSCWEWKGAIGPTGYGKFKIGGADIRAHRYAYELENGPIPEGLFILHVCDRRACCRPSHLVAGTTQDNMDDMVKKGRQMRGEQHHRAILTWDLVRDIRRRARNGEIPFRLAKEYGISPTSIYYILENKTWRE